MYIYIIVEFLIFDKQTHVIISEGNLVDLFDKTFDIPLLNITSHGWRWLQMKLELTCFFFKYKVIEHSFLVS